MLSTFSVFTQSTLFFTIAFDFDFDFVDRYGDLGVSRVGALIRMRVCFWMVVSDYSDFLVLP